MGTKYLFTIFALPFAYQFSTLFFWRGGGCMCHSTGYCFHLFDSGKGCENHPSSLEEGKMLPQHDSRTKIVQFFPIMLSLTILIKLWQISFVWKRSRGLKSQPPTPLPPHSKFQRIPLWDITVFPQEIENSAYAIFHSVDKCHWCVMGNVKVMNHYSMLFLYDSYNNAISQCVVKCVS